MCPDFRIQTDDLIVDIAGGVNTHIRHLQPLRIIIRRHLPPVGNLTGR